MSKQEAYKIVLEDLKTYRMLCGQYDAINGDDKYMYGVGIVMELIAEKAGEGDAFTNMFYKNMATCQAKAEVEHGRSKN